MSNEMRLPNEMQIMNEMPVVNEEPAPKDVHLTGRWTDGSARSAAISVTVTVDMSAWGRPTAHGSFVDASTIRVTFPDDATYTGTLVAPDLIRWSNNSTWRRVDLGKAEGGE